MPRLGPYVRGALLALSLQVAVPALMPAPLLFANPAKELGIPLPPGSRGKGASPVLSGQGFRKTVEFYERFFRRSGLAHEQLPVYAYRGTVVARFLSRQPDSRWLAVHVYRHEGRTMIYVVPRDPLTPTESQGKEASP